MPVRYVLRMPRPETHLFHVEMRVPARLGASDRVLRMATWTPGSYLVREFARHVEDFEATDARGRRVEAARIDKSGWRVDTGGALVVRYKVYAHELSVQTCHLDATHGYLNPNAVFLYSEDLLAEPCEVRVVCPRGWRVDTGLPRRGGAFRATDFDHLADSPMEIGTHRLLTFDARGRRHRVAIWGEGNEDARRLVHDLRKIVLEASAVFGGSLPYEDYLFILHLTTGGKEWGGLEHRNSTTILAPRFTFRPDREYERFLGLAAHEYFHTWNVKRIKPAAFVPYDWQHEVYTGLLWAMEGLTSYYDTMIVTRAGLRSERRHREELAELWKKLQDHPGRTKQDLLDSSRTTWVKFYRQDEHYPNAGISYYLKGELVGCALDLAIREQTGGKRSLDDVMRFLWAAYGKSGVGMPEDGFEPAVEAVTGKRFRDFFERYVEGTEDPPLPRLLPTVGWELRPVPAAEASKDKPEEHAGPGASLGVLLESRDGKPHVATVLRGGAAEAMGLAPGDEVVAFDGWRATDEALKKRLAERREGDAARVSVFRRGCLLTLEGRLGAPEPAKWQVRERKGASTGAKRRRDAWLGPARRRR